MLSEGCAELPSELRVELADDGSADPGWFVLLAELDGCLGARTVDVIDRLAP
jgi:hypothetical protein